MTDLRGKKILFIGTGFYDYEYEIKRKLENRGAEVYYFSSVSYTTLYRIYNKMGLKTQAINLLRSSTQRNIIKQPSDIDYVFIIKAENFNQQHIDMLKAKYKDKPFVLYFWDSMARMSNSEMLLKNFRNILTFDRIDALNNNLIFRPLFYRDTQMASDNYNEYSVSFVGGIHSIRFDIIKKIKKQLIEAGLNYKFLLWIDKRSYLWRRYITRSIKKEDEDLFTTRPIPYNEYIKISKRSKFILDISHPLQNGLTIRSVEAIGLGKRLITTNNDIVNYNFNREMYSVIEPLNPVIDLQFLKSNKCPGYNRDKYSLDSFIDDIIKYFE